MMFLDSRADNSEATSLVLGNLGEFVQSVCGHHTNITFLSFRAPDLKRTQTTISTVNVAKLEFCAKSSVVYELRQSVR